MTSPSEVVYHAQCPNCATISKINHPQLQQSKGVVTCRRCEHYFPARGHLLSAEHMAQLAAKLRGAKEARATSASVDTSEAQAPQTTPQAIAFTTVAVPESNTMTTTVDTAQALLQNVAPDTHVFVGLIEEEPAPAVQKMGLLAKLLIRKNTKVSDQNSDNASIVDEHTPTDGFVASKAKLHVDEIQKSSADITPKMSSESNVSASEDEFQIEHLDLSYVDALQNTKPVENTPKSAATIILDDVSEVVPAFSRNSKIESLLVRANDDSALKTLPETDVVAPDYEANKQWFTQMFPSVAAMELSANTVADMTSHTDNAHDLLQTAKRLHDTPNNSNTVSMRLPENSMLVFTLEDQGNSASSVLEFPKPEVRPYAESQTIQVLHVDQDEHTMWTVANIVAILVLIIQMFYYFLLLTP